MAYSFAQLEGYWIQAGGSKKLAPVMAAIALAESGGNPTATNPHDNGGRQTSWGLWQISDGTHHEPVKNILNPEVNASAAVAKYQSQGLGAWGTYSSGAYKHYLSSAKPVLPTGATGTGQAPGTTTAGGRGSGTGNVPPASGGGGSSSGGSKPSPGSLGGFFGSIWLGLKTGLGLSASSGNEVSNAIIGTQEAASSASDIAQAIAALTLPFVVIANALDWFFVPSHWIRIMAGVGGIVIGSAGVYELAHAGQDKPAALPIGIAGVGVGGVLLFVAFHNLDPNIKTVGELLSDLQSKVQSPGSTSPAAAVTAAGG